HRQHASEGRTFLLPGHRLEKSQDTHASLGTGHHGQSPSSPPGETQPVASLRHHERAIGMREETISLKYALITPAWNEEAHLDEVIRSVAGQILLPERWVIVSDGSTDRTDEIVQSYARLHSWIRLLRVDRSPVRNFAGKAHAVNAGYESLKP